MEEHKNSTSEKRMYLLIVEYVSCFAISFYSLSSHIATSIYEVILELPVKTYTSYRVVCSLFLFDFNRK